MRIGHFDLTERVLIVAEIGNNHEGNFAVAKRLVHKAAEAGVHAVKFQTFKTEQFVSGKDKARFDRLSSFELSCREFEKLRELAGSLGLLFISTPLDLGSAAFLDGLVDCYKIASADNNFYPLIEAVCATGKPLLLSSGLSDLKQVKKSKKFIETTWAQLGVHQEMAVLHCVSSYPVPDRQVDLAAIPFLGRKLRCTVGYSDHTLGLEAPLVAVSLGARVIEKHFTLDKNYSDFRDHQISADPPEMKLLVEKIERVLLLLGQPRKIVQECEEEFACLIRRSIVAAVDLPQGHCLAWRDLMWTRPARGLSPGMEKKLVGRTLKRSVSRGEPILPAYLN